jgi:hypothetical protein
VHNYRTFWKTPRLRYAVSGRAVLSIEEPLLTLLVCHKHVMGYDAIGHSSGYPSGFRHYVTLLRDKGITVIVLSNEATNKSKSINRNLTSIMLQEPIWFWEEKY